LSIVENGPASFAGRKVGALVTDGVDKGLLDALRGALEKEGAMLEIVAPTVGGVKASDGSHVEGDEKLDGGPSVLYDAVAILPSAEGGAMLAATPPARDFAADAFAHCKLIAYVDAAQPLFEKAGIAGDLDEGCIPLTAKGAAGFVKECRKLRHWQREAKVG
jgi:catalase